MKLLLLSLMAFTYAHADKPLRREHRNDHVPPIVTLLVTPKHTLKPGDPALFKFKSDGGATVECMLDGKQYNPCASDKDIVITFEEGRIMDHEFTVVAIDAHGNKGPVASYRWTVGPSKLEEMSKKYQERSDEEHGKVKGLSTD